MHDVEKARDDGMSIEHGQSSFNDALGNAVQREDCGGKNVVV
jgi:hypothetical protein